MPARYRGTAVAQARRISWLCRSRLSATVSRGAAPGSAAESNGHSMRDRKRHGRDVQRQLAHAACCLSMLLLALLPAAEQLRRGPGSAPHIVNGINAHA